MKHYDMDDPYGEIQNAIELLGKDLPLRKLLEATMKAWHSCFHLAAVDGEPDGWAVKGAGESMSALNDAVDYWMDQGWGWLKEKEEA